MDSLTSQVHHRAPTPRVVSWHLTRKVAMQVIQSSHLNSCWLPWNSVQLRVPVARLVRWSQAVERRRRPPQLPSLPLQISHHSCRKCPRCKHLRDALYLQNTPCLLLPHSLSAHPCPLQAVLLQVAALPLGEKGAAVQEKRTG